MLDKKNQELVESFLNSNRPWFKNEIKNMKKKRIINLLCDLYWARSIYEAPHYNDVIDFIQNYCN